ALAGELIARRRAVRAAVGDRRFLVASERAKVFRNLFPEAAFDPDPPEVITPDLIGEQATVAVVQGWMAHIGPTTAAELAAMLGVAESDIEGALLRLEAGGAVLRGKFRSTEQPAFRRADSADLKVGRSEHIEWCDRRLLARIHRLTLGRLRREIAPVTAAQFM